MCKGVSFVQNFYQDTVVRVTRQPGGLARITLQVRSERTHPFGFKLTNAEPVFIGHTVQRLGRIVHAGRVRDAATKHPAPGQRRQRFLSGTVKRAQGVAGANRHQRHDSHLQHPPHLHRQVGHDVSILYALHEVAPAGCKREVRSVRGHAHHVRTRAHTRLSAPSANICSA